MRVLLINTSERTGGAAVAANRLMEALINNGVKAKMLVRDKETDNINVVYLKHRLWQQWAFLWERWRAFCNLKFKREHLFEIDIANIGSDITKLHEFQEADVIHLHWTNQGFLSLKDIEKILLSGKRVVWTMHDFWCATAICHYPKDCSRNKSGGCQYCQYLPEGGSENDLSRRVWKQKEALYAKGNVTFVTCSQWLGNQVRESLLLKDKRVVAIPNPIDTRVFCPKDKLSVRNELGLPTDKRLVLLVSQRITDQRKGISYMIKAVDKLVEQHPEMKENTAVVILGGQAEDFKDKMALHVYPLGYVSNPQKIVSVYNSADVFVLPSLEDNLPNTIMEALACGVPCVGFKTGGIPEMIDHKENGYVAEYKNASDLAEGIRWTLQDADSDTLQRNAIKKVHSCYSQQAVAAKFIELYSKGV